MSSQKNVLEHRVLDDTKDSSHHHEEGASSSVSTLHSSKNRPPNDESRGVLMGDAFTVAHGTPSETVDRVYVTTTGPSPLGKAIGFQGQVYLVSEGNLACTRSKDGTHWRVHRQGNPKPQPILADDQRFNNHVHLESVAMCKAFLIHKDFEYYLNGHFSLYRDIPSKDTLEFTVALLQKNVEAILVDIPESVVLIRCDFPFYDSVDPESRVVIEHIILEYFRFPWLPNWKHKIRSALVQKPRPWFKSVTGEEDEVFPDDPLPNGYVAPSFDASTSPFVADQMPATTVSLPGLDDLLDTDTQPLSTAAGSAGNASQQDSAVALSFCDPPLPDKLSSGSCQSLDQVCLCVNPADQTPESTSGSNPEVTDITAALNGDGDPDSESMNTDMEEGDISLIDFTVSFPQESAVDHSTTWHEAESVSAIIGTDTNAATNKVDNPLLHVAQEYHNDNNNNNNNNNNDTEEPRQSAHIPEPARITVTNPRPDGRYHCSLEDCTKSYAKQGGLDVHIKSCHTPNGRQRCAFSPCTKTFAQPADCKRHENVTHRGYMYVCDNCGECYTRKPSAKDLNAMARCRSGAEGLHNFLLYIPELLPEPEP